MIVVKPMEQDGNREKGFDAERAYETVRPQRRSAFQTLQVFLSSRFENPAFPKPDRHDCYFPGITCNFLFIHVVWWRMPKKILNNLAGTL